VTVADGTCAARAAPRALSDAAGRERLLAWLEESEGTPAGAALRALTTDQPGARALLEAIASSSPYLWDLARADPDRLVALLDSDPDTRFAQCLARATSEMGGAVAQADAMRILRDMKAEAALLIALADIGGMWGVMRVAEALTALADTAVTLAVRHLLAGAATAGHLAPTDPARPEAGCGYVVLAMGKMGAGELNYSSDIDLIVLFDPDAPALVPGIEPAVLFVRLTRQLVKLLQERTTQGYVFRVDLRLRPDPASTQVAVSMPAALDYYESRGQNWERAAMIKARPCGGDIAAGQRMLAELSPFIWRKYLDFVALGDIHEMKRQIQAYRGCGEVAVEGHNVKLGRGGIREIEFFVQTQQLIAGGRHPALRGRETLATLEQLARGGWIDADARDDLESAYAFLRTVEHRLQMVADEQTHTLPSNPEELVAFARFMGYPDRDAFAAALLGHLGAVQRHYARLFEDAPARAAERRGLVFPPKADAPETLDKLNTMGFRQPIEVSQTVRRWLAGAPRALRGPAARTVFAELVPLLIDHIARAENPDAALIVFDRFLGNLHGGARLFSLLRQNPDLVALVASVLGTAPRLADTLAANPQVMDALIDTGFSGALPGPEALEASLAVSLAQSDSHEDFLDRVRAFGQEQMFLIGARILSGTVSARQAGEAFAGLADTVVRAMHRRIADSFVAAHGVVRGGASAVLAMGKLGGREMTASSDLDLIVVYNFDEAHPESDGARPLHAAPYFARFTQRLVNALTTQTNYGRLYAVDMRLRPSGRSGPVATSLPAFSEYQRKEAWTWEHMALTRARVASVSSPALAAEVETVIREVLCTPRDADMVAGDVVEMRRAVAAEKGDRARWDLKNVAGGLIDIEFIAQFLELVYAAREPSILNPSTGRVLERAARLGILSVEDAEVLRPAERLYQDLGQILRLCLTGPFEPKAAGGSLLSLLARAADVPDFAALEAHLAETQERVRKCFVRILGSAP
jgi:[glutamine synthetase] adenylyltransferase / [glutamine synthetase]-adenylyl-L-tyrosine phosphorylase